MTRPTSLGRSRALVSLTSIGGGGGSIDGTQPDGQFPGSGQVPTATGSNSWAWASNVARITSNTSNALLGPFVNFQNGSGIAFSVASNTLTIAASGSGGSGELDWVFVTDYGAVGDNSNDDTAAIQAAVNATPVGGVCYFPVPSSAYKITSAITIPHSMRLLGAMSFIGQYTKVRQATANTSAFVGPTTGSQHWAVDGLQITGPIGGQTSGAGIVSTQSVNVVRCLVQGFYDAVNITTDGTTNNAAYYVTLERSFFDSGTRAGVYLSGNANNFTWRDCRANSNVTGVRITGGPLSARLWGGAIELNSTTGLSIEGTGSSQQTSGVLVSGVYFEQDDGDTDISIGASSTVYAVTVEACTFVKSALSGTGWAIDATNVNGLTIIGNEFHSSDAVRCTSPATNVFYANNHNLNSGTVTLPANAIRIEPATFTTPTSVGGANSAGTSVYLARADHVHAGSASPLTTKGDLYTYSTVDARLAVGSNGTTPIADSGEAVGIRWSLAGASGEILITDTPAGTPLVFADLVQNEAEDDLVYADL